ncbi:MAG: hypothetical protein ACT4PU_06540 [Planctomycetota bacterium]
MQFEAQGGSVGFCEQARHEMCRLAIGAESATPIGQLALHARQCAACRESADAVATVCHWLETSLARRRHRQAQCGRDAQRACEGSSPLDAPRGLGGLGAPGEQGELLPTGEISAEALQQRSERALVRELAARLARDLLAVGQERPPRMTALRRRDLRRLLLLVGAHELRRPPWRAVVRRLGGRRFRPTPSLDLLALAVELDPLGLDLSLAYIARLEREGLAERANAEADRLLELTG